MSTNNQIPFGIERRKPPVGIPEFAPPPVSHQPPPLLRLNLRRAMQLHGKLAITIFAIGVMLAAGIFVLRKPKYSGSAVLYVQPSPPKLLPSGPAANWPNDSFSYEQHIQEQLKGITRYDVLKNALGMVANTGWQLPDENDQAAIERLEKALEVDRVGTSYQITIVAHAGRPDQAAALANAVANAYIAADQKQERAGDTERIKMLHDESDRVKAELDADRTEQETLNRKLGVAGVTSGTPNPYDDKIAALRGELVRARAAHDEAAAHLVSMQHGGLAAEADTAAQNDVGLASLKSSLNQRRSLLISQMANLTPNHPLYKQDADELAKMDASLAASSQQLQQKATANIGQNLSTVLETTAGTESRINAELAQATAEAGGSIRLLQRSNEVTGDIQRLEQRFATVDEQLRNQTLEDAAPVGVHLVSPAVSPLHADATRTARLALVLVLAFGLMGIGAAALRLKLDPRIYTAQDVEEFLGFPPMAVLPDSSEVSEGVNEEFLLRLTASIEGARQHSSAYRFVFTAPTTGTGVSLTVSRVKAMLDAMGKRAVLIDASSSQPTVVPAGVVAHGDPQPLSELSVALADSSDRPTEVLRAIDHFGGDPLTGQQDMVLTDAAPLPLSAEAEYLVRFSDATVVVLESGKTTRPQLEHVVQMLGKLRVRNVGFLLNRVALATADPIFAANIRSLEDRLRSTGWQAAKEKRTDVPTPAASSGPRRAPRPSAGPPPSQSPESRRNPVQGYGRGQTGRVAQDLAPEPVKEPVVQTKHPVASADSLTSVQPEPVTSPKSFPGTVNADVPASTQTSASKWAELQANPAIPPVTTAEPAPAEFVSQPLPGLSPQPAPALPAPIVAEVPQNLVSPTPLRRFPPAPSPAPSAASDDPFSPARVAIPSVFRDLTHPVPRWSQMIHPPDSMRNAPQIPGNPAVSRAADSVLQPGVQSPQLPWQPVPAVREHAPHSPHVPAEQQRHTLVPRNEDPLPNTLPERPRFTENSRSRPEASEVHEARRASWPADDVARPEPPRVLAQPEILPPEQGDDASERSPRSRTAREKDDDDMQILPSWRGQYRRQKP